MSKLVGIDVSRDINHPSLLKSQPKNFEKNYFFSRKTGNSFWFGALEFLN